MQVHLWCCGALFFWLSTHTRRHTPGRLKHQTLRLCCVWSYSGISSNRVIGRPNNERIATGYRKRYRGHTAGLGWSPMGFIRPLNPPQTARGPLPPPRRSKRWRYVPSPPFFLGSGVAPGVCRTPTSSTGPSMPSSRPAKNKLLLQRSGLLCFRPAKKR